MKALKEEADKDRKSNTQAAAAMATTNAARQAEMEMKIEKLQKEIEFRKREIDAIKSELKDKDQTAKNLKTDLKDAREDLISYRESVDREQAEKDEEKEQATLQQIANQDYLDADDVLSQSGASLTTANSSKGKGLLGGWFNQSQHDSVGENVDLEISLREKDARIDQLEKAQAENDLSISNLKNELVAASSKYKDDEIQRRLLIQRLENENQAYSIKLEVLEGEFEEIRKRKEAVALAKSDASASFKGEDDGSVSSTQSRHSETTSTSMHSSFGTLSVGTGNSSIAGGTGASRLTPLERDNKKLKKQKKVYETRIASLQTQLSEIQQIVPELMSKSKAQIQKLEAMVKTNQEAAAGRQEKLEEEVSRLKQHNEQLQAATRTRLQSSVVDGQQEIDQLKMRLEAREATIKKLEMLASRKKGGRTLRKKKKKTDDGEISVFSECTDATGFKSTYSLGNDDVLGSL